MKTSIEIHFVATKPGDNGSHVLVKPKVPPHSCAIRTWVEGSDGTSDYMVTDDRQQLIDFINSALDRDVLSRSSEWNK
jgi:hypothetical protein